MLCPNCKQELMNVNGRYICVDCGKEVPENEVPVAQAEHDGVEAKIEGNDYLYSDLPKEQLATEENKEVETPLTATAEAVPPLAAEVPVAEVAAEEVPNAVESEPVEEVAIEKPEAVVSATENSIPVENISETTNSENLVSQTPAIENNAIEENIPSVPEVPLEPQSVEVQSQEVTPDVSIPQPEIQVPPVATEPPETAEVSNPIYIEEQAAPIEPVVPIVSEPELPVVPVEQPVSSLPSVNPVAFDTLKPSVNPASTFSQDAPIAPENVQPVAENISEPVAEAATAPEESFAPAPSIGDYNFSQAAQVPQDRTVYQNPMYDQQEVEEPADKQIEEKVYQEVNRRKLIFIAVIGVVGLIVLIIAGVLIYNVLATPAKVSTVDLEEVVDCGSSGPNIADSETAKNCFAQYFQECKLAKYNETLDLGAGSGEISSSYEIIGKTDVSCSVQTKYAKNPNASYVNKKMECQLDNSKTFASALGEISKQNCSGPLADLMFGNQKPATN